MTLQFIVSLIVVLNILLLAWYLPLFIQEMWILKKGEEPKFIPSFILVCLTIIAWVAWLVIEILSKYNLI